MTSSAEAPQPLFDEGEVIEIYENAVIQPKKEIISPKKDSSEYLSIGHERLNDIYNDPF